MKRIVVIAIFALVCVCVKAQNEVETSEGYPIPGLPSNMETNDIKAWRAFRAKMAAIHKERPVVALVLGGGGAKGTAHIGVLKYLEEIGMPVDVVLGTSMGALMGGMYSLGYTSDQLDSLVARMDWPTMMSDRIPEEYKSYQERRYRETYQLSIPFDMKDKTLKRSLPSAYITGQNVSNLINSMIIGYGDDIRFCDLPTPFVCISTDLIKGKGVVWTSGSLYNALRTTMSIPLVFSPVRKDGRFLVDGGMIDNFPSDVAKAMGADIIIGVSVGSPSVEYSDAHNAMDVVSLAIDLSGKVRLEETLKIPDTVIYPELKGLTSLSFSKENVRMLMDNGYRAACDSSAVLALLRKKVTGYNMKRHAPNAKSLIFEDIKMSSLKFIGVNKAEEHVLREMLDIDEKGVVSRETMDASAAKLFGTNVFSNVTFNFSGKGPEYDVTLNCVKKPQHRLGLSARIDSEEIVAADVNLGFFANSVAGSRINVNLRASVNPYFCLEYSYNRHGMPRIFVAADIRYANTSFMQYMASPFRMDFLTSRQSVYFGDFSWSSFDIQTGLVNSITKVFGCQYVLDPNGLPYRDELVDVVNVYTGAFFKGKMDKLVGGSYFPTSGNKLDVGYSWNFKSNLKELSMFNNYNYHEVSLYYKGVTTPVDYFTFLFSLDVRLLFSHDLDRIPLQARNMVGGTMRGRYMDHQVAFPCMENVYNLNSKMMVLRGDFRFKPAPKHYVTPMLMIAMHNQDILKGYESTSFRDFMNSHSIYGGTIEYAYSSIIGPLKLYGGWCSSTRDTFMKGFVLGLSAGFDF